MSSGSSFKLALLLTFVALMAGAILAPLVGRLGWIGVPARGIVRAAAGGVQYVAVFTDDDGQVDDPALDPADDGHDPGYDKEVAVCAATIASTGEVRIELLQGYPGYACRFWTIAENQTEMSLGAGPALITAPPELRVFELESAAGQVFGPGERWTQGFRIRIEESAQQMQSYSFAIESQFTSDTAQP